MNRRLGYLWLLALVVVAACATPNARPTVAQFEQAHFGPPPPPVAEIEPAIRQKMEMELIDPFSAMYRFDEVPPKKVWWSNNPTEIHYGWRICGFVNAKNRMGGYVGWQRFFSFWSEGQVVAAGMSNTHCDA